VAKPVVGLIAINGISGTNGSAKARPSPIRVARLNRPSLRRLLRSTQTS